MPGRQAASGEYSPSPVVERIHATHAQFGLVSARPEEIAEARDFAAALIGGENASPRTLVWVHARTGAAVFLAREEGRLSGVWAVVLLSEDGVRACHDDRFDALDPEPAQVAEAWRDPAGVYVWGFAGGTRESAKRVVASGDAVDRAALAHLPCFTRPTTEAGRRLAIERKNFQPVQGSTSGLVWLAPRHFEASAAA
jgi:hypothetical protein